jgi:hypothetical protein
LRFGFRSVDLGLDGLSIVLTALAALWQPSGPSARPLSQWTINSAQPTVHDKGALDYGWRDVSLLCSLLFFFVILLDVARISDGFSLGGGGR